jgi:cobalt-zinc-cadmium efflux system outer membrane protein
MKIVMIIIGAFFSYTSWASDYHDFLPSDEEMFQSLSAHPWVMERKYSSIHAQAQGDRLRAGDTVWQLKMGTQRREITNNPDYSYEPSIAIEKKFRLWNKYSVDKKMAKESIQLATIAEGDAWHEAAKSILKSWFDVLRLQAEQQTTKELIKNFSQEIASLKKRVKAGDAAQLDVDILSNELKYWELNVITQQNNVDKEKAELTLFFKGNLPVFKGVDDFLIIHNLDADTWVEKVLAENHELELLKKEVDLTELKLKRSQQDKLPDPTFSLGYSQENFKQEKLIALSVALPLPHASQWSQVRMDEANKQKANLNVQVAVARLTQETKTKVTLLQHLADSVVLMDQQIKALTEQQRKVLKAFQLGEMGLSELTLSQRQWLAAKNQYNQLRLDWLENYSRLLLDAHILWAMPEL